MPRTRAARVLRGTAAATVATFVALLSHVAGGGAMPGWLGIAVPWVLSLAVSTVLAGRALSIVRLVPAVAISQLLFHTLFVLGATPGDAVATVSHHGTVVMTAAAATPLAPDTTMWLSHAVAAALTVAFLHRGERTLRALARIGGELAAWLRRVIRRSSPTPLPALPRTARIALHTLVAPVSRALVDAAPRRGPPLPSAI
jgi:hypothetical protein